MDIYRYPGHSLATARLTAIEGISPASIAVPEALDIGITGQGDSKTWTEMLELRVQRVNEQNRKHVKVMNPVNLYIIKGSVTYKDTWG